MDLLSWFLIAGLLFLLCRAFYADTRLGQYLDQVSRGPGGLFDGRAKALDGWSLLVISLGLGVAFTERLLVLNTLSDIGVAIGFYLYLAFVLWLLTRPRFLLRLHGGETIQRSVLVGEVAGIYLLILPFGAFLLKFAWGLGFRQLIVVLLFGVVVEFIATVRSWPRAGSPL